MKKLIFLMAIAVVLSACSSGAEEPQPVSTPAHDTSTTSPAGKETKSAKQAARPKPAVRIDKSRPFCGSRMSIEEAIEKADLVVQAKSLTVPFLEEETEAGVIHSFGQKFKVVRMLKDELGSRAFLVNYVYIVPERRVEKGEEVCLFIKEKIVKKGKIEGNPPKEVMTEVPCLEAIKIIPANREMRGKIRQLLDKKSASTNPADNNNTNASNSPQKTRQERIAEMIAVIESVPPWYKGRYSGKLHIKYEQYGEKQRKILIEAAKKIQGYYLMKTTSPDEHFFSELREAIVYSIKKYPPANYNSIKGKIHLLLSMVFNLPDGYPLVFDEKGLFTGVTNMHPLSGGPFDPLRRFDGQVKEGYCGFRDLK